MFGTLLFGDTFGAQRAPGALGEPYDAAATAPAAGPTPAGLAALDFLVGGVWVTTAGQATVAERVVWDTAHTFLMTEVTQTVAGKVAALARGYFGYAPVTQTLLSSALSTTGSYTGGYETASPNASTWVFAMICGQGPEVQNVQVTMEHPALDQLVISQAIQQGGSWVPKSSATYQRCLDGQRQS